MSREIRGVREKKERKIMTNYISPHCWVYLAPSVSNYTQGGLESAGSGHLEGVYA
jgi:hypothetical protein